MRPPRPDQRRMQHVTRHNAGEQDHDLSDDEDRRGDFHQSAEDMLKRSKYGTAARGLCSPPDDASFGDFGVSHDGHPTR